MIGISLHVQEDYIMRRMEKLKRDNEVLGLLSNF